MKPIDVSVLKEWIENWFTKNRFYHPYAKNNNIPITELYDILEQMPSAHVNAANLPQTCNQLATDCISRQAAIDIVEEVENKRLKGEIDLTYAPMIKGINALPSAQPEIIRCRECKYAVNVGTPDMMCNKSETWVVATDNDFGCVLAERRTDETD